MNYSVYISSPRDETTGEDLRVAIETVGLTCWTAQRDLPAGAYWGQGIIDAIRQVKVVVAVLSSLSADSQRLYSEIEFARKRGIPIVPYRVDSTRLPTALSDLLSDVAQFDGTGAKPRDKVEALVAHMRALAPDLGLQMNESPPRREREKASKGYVFISYVRADADFVEKLREVLAANKYGYWDYTVADRDYHGALYRELEDRIDGAKAFMTIVTDAWRNSEWVAAEFLYAREAAIPIFVIEAKRLSKPLPILLNLQTRINMVEDFDRGSQILAAELSKKRL